MHAYDILSIKPLQLLIIYYAFKHSSRTPVLLYKPSDQSSEPSISDDLDRAMMSNLLAIIIAFSATLLLTLNTLPADAVIKGSLTSKGGHVCTLRERVPPKSGSTGRRLRLSCKCKNDKDEDVEYKCFYKSDTSRCCKKSKEASWAHYHSNAIAYYAQVADQIKGK